MSTATVIPGRLARFLRDDFHLRAGAGWGGIPYDFCAMQAADWLSGGDGRTSRPACVPSSLHWYLIRLNDSLLFSGHLDAFKPYVPRVVGLDRSPEVEALRGFVAADHAVRVFAPTWLRARNRVDWAIELESIAPVVDRDSAIRARDTAARIRESITAIAVTAADGAASGLATTALNAAARTISHAVYAWIPAVLRARSLECLEAMIAVA